MSVAKELGIIQTAEKRYELEGFEGQVYSSVAVRAEMVFLDRTFRGHLLLDQGWGVIGRNVLNSLSLLFDGPSQTWQQPTLG